MVLRAPAPVKQSARRGQQRHRRVQAQPVAADVRVGRDLERIVRARRRARQQSGRELTVSGETSTETARWPQSTDDLNEPGCSGSGGAAMPLPMWKLGCGGWL